MFIDSQLRFMVFISDKGGTKTHRVDQCLKCEQHIKTYLGDSLQHNC